MNPEHLGAISLDTIRAAVRAVSANHPLARVAVFGSVVNGGAEARSDVDLLVEFLPGAPAGLLEMRALREDLEEILGRAGPVQGFNAPLFIARRCCLSTARRSRRSVRVSSE